MPQPVKPVYKVQGHEFVLKETSPDVRDEINEFMREYQQGLLAKSEAVKVNLDRQTLLQKQRAGIYDPEKDGPIPDEIEVEFDEYEFYFRLFCALTRGPHDKLNPRQFDIKVAEAAKDDFLPEGYKIANSLMLFSQSLAGSL